MKQYRTNDTDLKQHWLHFEDVERDAIFQLYNQIKKELEKREPFDWNSLDQDAIDTMMRWAFKFEDGGEEKGWTLDQLMKINKAVNKLYRTHVLAVLDIGLDGEQEDFMSRTEMFEMQEKRREAKKNFEQSKLLKKSNKPNPISLFDWS